MYKHWQQLDAEDPILKLFLERGYTHYKPSPCHPNLFSKSFIYHNGIKFVLVWKLYENSMELTMVTSGEWVKWNVRYSDVLSEIPLMEIECNIDYKLEKRLPLTVLNKETDEYLKSIGHK